MQYMPSLYFQVGCILYSAGLGFSLGIIYDLFRMLFYLLTGSDKKLVNLRDIIYSIVCLAATFLFLLVMCDGQLLVYVFIAEAVGAYIYFRTLSRQIFSPVRKVIVIIRRFFARIKRFLSEIKTRICTLNEKMFKKLHKIAKKDLHIRHNLVYNFFVKLRSGSLLLKNRGDDSGKSREKET